VVTSTAASSRLRGSRAHPFQQIAKERRLVQILERDLVLGRDARESLELRAQAAARAFDQRGVTAYAAAPLYRDTARPKGDPLYIPIGLVVLILIIILLIWLL
jgi:hypothetical protein